jgi:norsolorinic acid ketoreductase
MVPENSPTYLVTGATRGIGRELVRQLSADKNATVIAAVRVLDSPQTKSLQKEHPNVIVVKIDAEVDTDPFDAAKKLRSRGISKVDTIIANAGKLIDFSLAAEVKTEHLRDLFQVNAIAPLVLFQGFKPLLDGSSNPKFVVVSTMVASLAIQAETEFKMTSYGGTKAASNFFTARLAAENKNITVYSVHPGTVATDMAAIAMKSFGMTLDEVLKN